MTDFYRFLAQDLRCAPYSSIPILLIFLSLIAAFGVICAPRPDLWKAFLPVLLMGLSYGMMALSLDVLFREDWDDGSLEWVMAEGKSLEIYVLGKIGTHWISLGIPLAVIIGVISGFSSLPLVIGVVATTLTIALLGAAASALCLMSKKGSLLLPLLTLPLSLPMMIVSMGAVTTTSGDVLYYLLLQAGLLSMAFAVSLIACPFALRLSFR